MKRALCFAVGLVLLSAHASVFAAESKMLTIRNAILEDSRQIRAMIPSSKDQVVLTSLFDSCLISVLQADAYFSMLGIYESAKKESFDPKATGYLAGWLKQMRLTNDANLKILGELSQPVGQGTKAQVEKVKADFAELNRWVDAELVKVNLLQKAQKKPR